jgi:hypothetical protein
MDEPIEWVGGQPEGARPRRWPYALVPIALIVMVGASALAWGSIRSGGRVVADSVLPYTVGVNGKWSAQDMVVGGPISMTLTIDNTDPRKLQGMTLRLKGLNPGWQIIGAAPSAQIGSDTIFFSQLLAPGKSEDLTVKLMPTKAGASQIQLSLSPGRTTRSITMKTSATAQGTTINAQASVRDATATDLSVQPQLLYVPTLGVGTDATWDVQIQNLGTVRITSVTVAFPVLPPSFQVTTTSPAAAISNGGKNVRFATILDPGDGETLTVHFVPHTSGTFHVAAQLFLSDQPDPIVLPNGDRAVNFDVTVN